MASPARLPFTLIACVVLHASTIAAQTVAATGAVTGRVTDTTGQALAVP